MRKFEIPYNFDKELINKISKYKDSISVVYLPTFFKHMKDARHAISITTKYYPDNIVEYESHVSYIIEKGLKPAILLQNPSQEISDDLLYYYINLGVKDFIVGKDSLAYRLRQIDSSLNIIASVTKCLSLKQIIDNQKEYELLYNSIVLFFPFNRALKKLNLLPKQLKYTFLLANECSYNCTIALNHWFDEKSTDNYLLKNFCYAHTETQVLIYPQHLPLFDQYAYNYKIQGRHNTTDAILDIFFNFYNVKLVDENDLSEYVKKNKEFIVTYTKERFSKELISKKENIISYYNSAINNIFLKQ